MYAVSDGEIRTLVVFFNDISNSETEDGVIDKSEFKKALHFHDGLFVDRMFELFDSNADRKINFREFLQGVSMLSEKGTFEEKVKFSFRIYDHDGDAKISMSELSKMVEASLKETGLEMSEDDVRVMLNETYKTAGNSEEGFISAAEYENLMKNNLENFMASMTVPVRALLAQIGRSSTLAPST